MKRLNFLVVKKALEDYHALRLELQRTPVEKWLSVVQLGFWVLEVLEFSVLFKVHCSWCTSPKFYKGTSPAKKTLALREHKAFLNIIELTETPENQGWDFFGDTGFQLAA